MPNHDSGESIKLFRWRNVVVIFVGDTDGLLSSSLDSQGGLLGLKRGPKWLNIEYFLLNHDSGESLKLFWWSNLVVMFVGDADGLLAPSLLGHTKVLN